MALAKKRKAPAKVRPAKSFVIDVHTHIHVPAVSELLDKVKPSAKDRTFFGTDNRATGGSGPLLAGTDPKRRLRHMDKTGVDMQVVSVNGSPPFYWADAALGAKISRAANEGVAGYVAAKPDRFVGLGMVPLQSPARAIKELEYAMGPLGLKGVIGLSNVRGADLGDPKFWPFWAKAEELGAAVLIHPLGFTHPDRMKKFRIYNTVGQPLEETLAMLSLIHEGVMDKFPKVKIVVGHGGGYLPYYAGRSDSTYHHHPGMRGEAKRPPSEYLKQFYFDSCVFDRSMTEFLVGKAGAGHVMLGTDYPFRIWDGIGTVRGSRVLSKESKDKILWKNAAQLMNIRV
ncbi:MAG: amidohydrolase family protein [Proteobacteria bacterium]|nr:amidohydrolase family protein [Pseudomonadota bacterium]